MPAVTVFWDVEDLADGWTEPAYGCPACGDTMDYCQGHGAIGDPVGHRILWAHDMGNHDDCHGDSCDQSPDWQPEDLAGEDTYR